MTYVNTVVCNIYFMFHPKILNIFGLMSRCKVVYGSFHVKLNISMLCFQIGFQLNIHIVILMIRVLIRTTKRFWKKQFQSLEVKMAQSLKQPFSSTLFWKVFLTDFQAVFGLYIKTESVVFLVTWYCNRITKFISLCTKKNSIISPDIILSRVLGKRVLFV